MIDVVETNEEIEEAHIMAEAANLLQEEKTKVKLNELVEC
jgi:hypothetical protein